MYPVTISKLQHNYVTSNVCLHLRSYAILFRVINTTRAYRITTNGLYKMLCLVSFMSLAEMYNINRSTLSLGKIPTARKQTLITAEVKKNGTVFIMAIRWEFQGKEHINDGNKQCRKKITLLWSKCCFVDHWCFQLAWERVNILHCLTWASYQIRMITGCAGNAGNFFSATDFKWNR